MGKFVKKIKKTLMKIIKLKKRICKKKYVEQQAKPNTPTPQQIVKLVKNDMIVANKKKDKAAILKADKDLDLDIGSIHI